MIELGINGLGRIGKSILTQCVKDKNISVKAINMPNFKIDKIASYISHDSVHKTSIPKCDIRVVNENTIQIYDNIIHLLDERTPSYGEFLWKKSGANYVFDTTGKFLTTEKAFQHNVDYFIMCAPPKDNTKQFLYNGNHTKYKGEHIISASSCTTNCIVPFLKVINESFGIIRSNFLTVHAATASQNVIDGVHLKDRSHRSVFNNIIPHTTGASKSAIKIIPNLHGVLHGSSVRIPTSNVSMVDINVLLDKKTSLEELLSFLRSRNELIVNDDEHLVSGDFLTTACPTIVDSASSMTMADNEFKFTIWYDNEWSYSAQAINLLKHIHEDNENHKKSFNSL